MTLMRLSSLQSHLFDDRLLLYAKMRVEKERTAIFRARALIMLPAFTLNVFVSI